MTGILIAIWFLIYGLTRLGVGIPRSDTILAVLALIIGIVGILTAI